MLEVLHGICSCPILANVGGLKEDEEQIWAKGIPMHDACIHLHWWDLTKGGTYEGGCGMCMYVCL